MATYQFTKPYVQLDESKLKVECVAIGLPVTDVQRLGDEAQTIYVITDRDLSGAEQAALANAVAAHDGRPRRKRKVYDMYVDIAALTATQQSAIAADLFGGSPPKYTQDEGDDAPDLLVLWVLSQTGLSAADKNLVKRAAAAIYARDNPKYLVNPPFAPAINIPGDELY